MAVQVNDLISKAGTLLNDSTHVRWLTTELLGWLNDAQREIVNHRPESSVTTATVSVSGSSRVALPAGGISLIRVIRTIGGNAIRVVSREVMDAQQPGWHNVTGSSIAHYMYDPRDPKAFNVYPVPSSPASVEISYTSVPATISEGGNISLDDIYSTPMLDYAVYRAYSKDAEYAQNAQAAAAYYGQFANFLGLTTKTSIERNPNMLDGGFNPNVPTR